MSARFRVFFVDSNDRLYKVPVKRFERLVLRNDSSERFPEFAGQRVRYALVSVEVEDRRPVSINRTDYSILKLRAGCKINFSDSDARRWHKPAA